jgi:hypothetical protein
MVVGFTITCAISAYHHYRCEFEPRSWQGVLDTTVGSPDCIKAIGLVWFVVFNTTFNNISVMSLRSVLLVEEIGVPGENH